MSVLVVGAGATGGYFGARLAEAGSEVTFLATPRRAARLRANGLVVSRPGGDIRLAPTVVVPGDPLDRHDIVLLAVKAYSLDHAIADLAPAVGSGTLILPLLNGMRHIDLLIRRFGPDAVLGGVCRLSAVVAPDGVVRQFNPTEEIAYGPLSDPAPPSLSSVADELGRAPFTTRPCADIRREMWAKWVYVTAVGAVTTLAGGVVGSVVAAPYGRVSAERVLAECAAVAAACHAPLDPDVLAGIRAALTEPGAPTASSLYWDLTRGDRVEADHLIDDLVERGREAGVTTPLLEFAHTRLDVYQRERI